MEARGVATRGTALELFRERVRGPHLLTLELLQAQSVAFSFFRAKAGVEISIAPSSHTKNNGVATGYLGDGSTTSFTGQSLAAPVTPKTAEVNSTTGSPTLKDVNGDGVLYAQAVGARKLPSGGTFAAMAGEVMIVKVGANGLNQTITFGTEASQALAITLINEQLDLATASALDGDNVYLTDDNTGYDSRIQVVSCAAGITTKLGISTGIATNNMGTVNYFTGALVLTYANGYSPSGGSASAAVLTSSNAAPYNFDPGDTLVADIDGVGDKTATFDAAQASHETLGASFAASNSETFGLTVDDGGELQTIAMTAGGETNITEYIARLNLVMLGAHAEPSLNSLRGAIGLVNECKADYNAHCADATAHTNADGTNVTAVADALTTVVQCDDLFDDLKAKMNAHLIDVSEVEEAVTLCVELRANYEAHRVALSHEEECATLVNDCRTKYMAHLVEESTLNEVYTLLNALKVSYDLHILDITPFHDVADAVNPVAPTANATTFATAVTLVDKLQDEYEDHRVQATIHPINDTFNVAAGSSAPATLANLVISANDIRTYYLAHLNDTTNGIHNNAPDAENTMTAVAAGTADIHLEADVTNVIGGAATTYAQSYTLAADIQDAHNDHIDDTSYPGALLGWHTTNDTDNPVSAAPNPPTTPTELVATLTELKADINLHLGNNPSAYHEHADTGVVTEALPSASIHDVDNTTENIAAGAPTNLAECYTVSDQFRTAYNLHRVDNSENSHPTNDTVNTITPAGAPATLDELILLLHDAKAKFNAHIASITYHNNADTATNELVAVDVRTAAIHEVDDTTNTITGSSDTTLGTLLTNLTEFKTDFNAHRTQATIHDANDTTNVVARTDDAVKLVSDKYGTDSAVEITTATGTILEKLGLVQGDAAAGTGDVADIDAVTSAEFKALVEEDIKTASAGDLVEVTNVAGKQVLTSQTTGASSSVNVNASSDVEAIVGLSTTITNGLATAPTALLGDWVQGLTLAGKGKFVEVIQNLSDINEFVCYAVALAGNCEVKANLREF